MEGGREGGKGGRGRERGEEGVGGEWMRKELKTDGLGEDTCIWKRWRGMEEGDKCHGVLTRSRS